MKPDFQLIVDLSLTSRESIMLLNADRSTWQGKTIMQEWIELEHLSILYVHIRKRAFPVGSCSVTG